MSLTAFMSIVILTFYFYTSYLSKQTIYISAKLFAVLVAALAIVNVSHIPNFQTSGLETMLRGVARKLEYKEW